MATARASLRGGPARCGALAMLLLCLSAAASPLWAQPPGSAASIAAPSASPVATPAALPVAASIAAPIAALDSPVRDLAGALNADTRARLQLRAHELRARKGAQLQVLIVDSTAPDSIEAYAQRAFDSWRLGRAGVDDGVLLVLARADRRARIQVGYGLEGRIPDAAAQRVLADYLLPHLARGEYDQGVDAASAALAALIEQEPLPPPAASAYRDPAGVAPAWRPIDSIAALGFGFALALGWCARRRGWPLALAAPAALLPPALAAWAWSGPSWLWLALLSAAAGGALGQALPPRRWLRSAAGAAAVGLAIAAIAAALVRRGVPAPGDIGLAALSVLLATPLLVGVVAPPMIAWQNSRAGFAVRAVALAGLAWLAWRALQRMTGGDLSGLGAGSWLLIGALALFAWMLVFALERQGRSASRSGGARGRGDGRRIGDDGGERSASPSTRGGSAASAGDGGWSGGGGRSGGGGASGSW